LTILLMTFDDFLKDKTLTEMLRNEGLHEQPALSGNYDT